MSDCTSRYLTADGLVLRCFGDVGAWHRPVAGSPQWTDDDPCGWDSTCGDCNGSGEVSDDPYGVRIVGCRTCEATGKVDAVPTRLVGVGSVLERNGSRLIVTHVVGDGTWALTDLDTEDGWIVAPSAQDAFTLVRAVPPIYSTTEQPLHDAGQEANDG